LPTPLLAGEHKQLSVDGEQLGDGVLKLRPHPPPAKGVGPFGGNGLDVLLAVDPEVSDRTDEQALSAMAA